MMFITCRYLTERCSSMTQYHSEITTRQSQGYSEYITYRLWYIQRSSTSITVNPHHAPTAEATIQRLSEAGGFLIIKIV